MNCHSITHFSFYFYVHYFCFNSNIPSSIQTFSTSYLNSLVFTQNSVKSTSQCKPTLQKTHLQSNFQQIKLEILMDFFTCCPYMVYLWSHVPTTVVFCLALFHQNDMFLLNHIWQFCCQYSSKAGGPKTTSTAFWQNKSGYVNYIWLTSLLPDSPMTSSEINIQDMTEPKIRMV